MRIKYGKVIAFLGLSALPLLAGVSTEHTGSTIILRVTAPQKAQLQPLSTPQGDFVRLVWPDLGVTASIGDPQVPVLRRLFLAARPQDLEVSVRVLHRHTIALGETPLAPVQPPVPKIPGARVPFAWNRDRYQEATPYPETLWRVESAGTLRHQPLVLLEVFPVQYHPLRNEVDLLDLEITVRVRNTGLRHPEYLSAPFLDELRRLVVNNDALRRVPPAPVGYLILVPDAYVNTVQPYAQWFNARGYHVTVTPLSDIGSSPTNTQIRAYIQNAYNTWAIPPTFVLLVGDVDQIPHFTGQGPDNPDTDLNYGLMDDSDYFPDLYVGRWSVSSADELAAVVNKTLAYEQTAWSQGRAWAQRAYFMASDDGSYHDVAEGTHLYAMGIVRAHGMIADSLFEYYGTGTPVATALNDGRALAVYSGHGYEEGWAGPSFDTTDIHNLTNTDRYPMVQSFACLTGSYASYDECFMEAWLRAQDRGAVVALGSSVTSYWDEDDILERRMFDAHFDSAIVWVMGFVNNAKYALYLHYGNTSTVRRYFEMYNLFGAPSVDLFTQVPETLYVSHPATVPGGATSITFTVTDPSGAVAEALVGVRNQNDELLASGYTDASGEVTLPVNPSPGDTLLVTVTAHNHTPSYSQILTNVEGPYVLLQSWVLNDENGDEHPNPGESGTLTVCVKNYGNQTAYGVTGTLTGPSGVTITDDQESFGTLAPGDSVIVADAYAMVFGQDLADGQTLPFTLTFTYSLGDPTASDFSMTVYAPLLNLGTVTVQDSGGDGAIDPGERVTFFAAARNDGHLAVSGVTGVLRTQDPYLVLIDSLADYGTVDVGAEVQGSGFEFRSDPSTPLHHQATLTVTWTSGFYEFTDTFQIQIGAGGHFLVWDPDPNHSSGPVIYSILKDSLGYVGDYTTNLAEYADELPYYQSLFVCVGIYSDNYRILEGSDEAQWIEDYLAAGGRVYLEGGDVWYYDPNSADGHDFGPTFGINATADGSGDLATVLGQPGTFTEGMSFTYGGENSWIDHLEPSASTAFLILANSSPSYGCGVANDAGTYKTVGLSFELAGLGGGSTSRSDLLQAIMEFFLGTGGTPDLALSPTAFQEIAQPGDSVVQTLTLQNLGDGTLRFTLSYRATRSTRTPRPLHPSKTFREQKGLPEPKGNPQTRGAGGPDAFGYQWRDSHEPDGPTFAWVDISSVGTPLGLADDGDAVVDLPWGFPFYGNTFSSVRVSSNGYLTFGTEGTDYTNDPIPDGTDPNALIAPFWDDLNPSSGGEVYTYYDASSDRFIVEWYQVPHYGASAPYTFEAILYPNGRIVFQYLDLQGDLTSATVGIENAAGDDGLQVVYNAAYLENNLAVEIWYQTLWLRFSPGSGTLQPGETLPVRVVMDASELDEGTYRDTLYVHSNDPDESVAAVPVTLIVQNWLYGDLDQDGLLTAQDIDLLAQYLYLKGPAPDPLEIADVNRDGQVNDADLVALSRQVMGSRRIPARILLLKKARR